MCLVVCIISLLFLFYLVGIGQSGVAVIFLIFFGPAMLCLGATVFSAGPITVEEDVDEEIEKMVGFTFAIILLVLFILIFGRTAWDTSLTAITERENAIFAMKIAVDGDYYNPWSDFDPSREHERMVAWELRKSARKESYRGMILDDYELRKEIHGDTIFASDLSSYEAYKKYSSRKAKELNSMTRGDFTNVAAYKIFKENYLETSFCGDEATPRPDSDLGDLLNPNDSTSKTTDATSSETASKIVFGTSGPYDADTADDPLAREINGYVVTGELSSQDFASYEAYKKFCTHKTDVLASLTREDFSTEKSYQIFLADYPRETPPPVGGSAVNGPWDGPDI